MLPPKLPGQTRPLADAAEGVTLAAHRRLLAGWNGRAHRRFSPATGSLSVRRGHSPALTQIVVILPRTAKIMRPRDFMHSIAGGRRKIKCPRGHAAKFTRLKRMIPCDIMAVLLPLRGKSLRDG